MSTSLLQSLQNERKARLARIAARAVPQAAEPPPSAPVRLFGAARRAGQVRDADYERVWACEIMGVVEGRERPRRPRLVEIQHAAARQFGIPTGEMLTAGHAQRLSVPRHVAMYLARTLTPKSFAEIGRAFGGRDHTTVLHAVNGIERRLQHDSELAHHIACIRAALGYA